MKKTIYFFTFFLISFFGLSQEKNTIEVLGRAIHIDSELTFESIVSLNNSDYSNSKEVMSLDELKSRYNIALKKNGLSLTDLEEDLIGYIYLRYYNYNKEGTMYHFKTTSEDKFNRFLKSKSFGFQSITYGYSMVISENEAQLVVAKAIQNAKEKAQAIAYAANKKVGDIVKVKDNNLINIRLKNQPLYYDYGFIPGRYIYDITVIFELKDKQ